MGMTCSQSRASYWGTRTACLVYGLQGRPRNGSLAPRVRGLVTEWAELHQAELLQMWDSKEFHKLARLIAPSSQEAQP